jgi:hypothetical protein
MEEEKKIIYLTRYQSSTGLPVGIYYDFREGLHRMLKMRRFIFLIALFGIFFVCSNAFAEVEDVKVELALNKDCIILISYMNRSKEVLNGTLTLNIHAGMDNKKEIADYKINLALGQTEVIDTQVRVSGEEWVFVQTSFSGAGTGTAIMVPVDKTLKCSK